MSEWCAYYYDEADKLADVSEDFSSKKQAVDAAKEYFEDNLGWAEIVEKRVVAEVTREVRLNVKAR